MKKISRQQIEDGMIPDQLYEKIVQYMPIPSVEAMIVNDRSLLFLKRKNNPAKGRWWFPGGRIRKGEPLEETLSREVRQETGLEVTEHQFVNVYSRVFPERHDITIVFLCICDGGEIVLNDEHSEHRYFREVPADLHPFILEAIKDSEWSKYPSV